MIRKIDTKLNFSWLFMVRLFNIMQHYQHGCGRPLEVGSPDVRAFAT